MKRAIRGLAVALALFSGISGCIHDTRTWPEPLSSAWGSGHCSTMFAAEVLGCTYTDEDGRVSHEVCFVDRGLSSVDSGAEGRRGLIENERGSWWCSGRRAEPAPPCFICGANPEIARADAAPAVAAHDLEPWYQEHFDLAAWLAFRKR